MSISRGVGAVGCEQVLTKESRKVPEPEMEAMIGAWDSQTLPDVSFVK